jgi:hypothetical protein
LLQLQTEAYDEQDEQGPEACEWNGLFAFRITKLCPFAM